MAVRPVFVAISRPPFYKVVNVEFTFNAGFAPSQKRKNVEAIHRGFKLREPSCRMLEISTKSCNELGVNLSAFVMKKWVDSLGESVTVENLYHGGKKFSNGGPYTDLYSVHPRQAKRDPRLVSSGALCSFVYEGREFPRTPVTSFYDWLYISALVENKELARDVVNYDAFTDIEFIPNKSVNCQARATAIYVGMCRAGLVDKTSDFCFFTDVAA